MTACPRCTSMVEQAARFCVVCGLRLDLPPSAPEQPPAPESAMTPAPTPGADVTSSIELVACPECGGSNAARRRRCGRCGAALHPESDVPVLAADQVPPEPAFHLTPGLDLPVTPPRRRVSGGWIVAGLGVLVGAGLGVALALGIGPFAPEANVRFDGIAYPGDPTNLMTADSLATSTAPARGDRTFTPQASRDGDLATAWRAGTGDESPTLVHRFVTPVWIRHVEIATGDQHDAETFQDAGRVTLARIDLGTLVVEATLGDERGVQVVRLPSPVLVDEVSLTATTVVGDGAAIAEVRYGGWTADDEDAESFRSS